MGKEKIRLEYMLKAGSGNVVWSIISTPSGLETWFADKITFKDKVFTFKWGKTESREAEVINLKSASNLNGNLNCSKELEHYAS